MIDLNEKYYQQTKQQLIKAIEHLQYSYNKILKLSVSTKNMTDEILETWESFCARFARVSDIFFMKYIKITVKLDDPGFNGTFRDYLNQAVKLELITDINLWIKIRETRNTLAHEYSTENLERLLLTIKKLAPSLLNLKDIL